MYRFVSFTDTVRQHQTIEANGFWPRATTIYTFISFNRLVTCYSNQSGPLNIECNHSTIAFNRHLHDNNESNTSIWYIWLATFLGISMKNTLTSKCKVSITITYHEKYIFPWHVIHRSIFSDTVEHKIVLRITIHRSRIKYKWAPIIKIYFIICPINY